MLHSEVLSVMSVSSMEHKRGLLSALVSYETPLSPPLPPRWERKKWRRQVEHTRGCTLASRGWRTVDSSRGPRDLLFPGGAGGKRGCGAPNSGEECLVVLSNLTCLSFSSTTRPEVETRATGLSKLQSSCPDWRAHLCTSLHQF